MPIYDIMTTDYSCQQTNRESQKRIRATKSWWLITSDIEMIEIFDQKDEKYLRMTKILFLFSEIDVV